VSFTGTEFTRPFDVNSLTAICFNAGHVTQDMLDVHARKFSQMQSLTTAPPMQDYVGVTMFTTGMSFWSNMIEELEQVRDLHKIYTYFDYGLCLASITPEPGSGNSQWRIPRLDVPYRVNLLSNSSIHPGSSQTQAQVQQDDYFLEAGVGSANEHYALNSFFGKEQSVSTVQLLRLANSRHASTAGNNGQGFFSFTRSEFAAANTDPAYATLKAEAGAAWTAAYTALQIGVSGYVPSGWEMVYVTPFDIAMEVSGGAAPAYNGMGLLYVVPGKIGALIDGQASGGVGEEFQSDIFNTSNFQNLSFSFNLDGGYELVDFSDLDFGLLVASVGNNDLISYYNNISLGNLFIDSFSETAWNVGFDLLGHGPSTDLGAVGSAVYSEGWLGAPSWHNMGGLGNSFVSDPVNVINGEFYVDAVDLTLPGPFPLQIRRNYSSQNEALNILGYGWKFSLTPYINVTQDGGLVYAADPDGSVVAYRKVAGSTPERWEPSIADNPLLNNYNGGNMGGQKNPFNAYVLKTTEAADTIYTLYKPDGNTARYRVRSFPITSGGSTITRQRPYLERWSDALGNYFTFSYYETSTDPEYGQLRRIDSTNGSYLGFRYNATGLVTEIFTHDGRRVSYRYDKYGDLVGVTLPDNAATAYEYKILTDAANGNTPYSTHLLAKERKPDGRVLENVYDPLYDPQNVTYSQAKYRRVKEQWGTVGVDLVPIKFADFEYSPAGDPWVAAGFEVTYVHSDVRPSKGRLTTTYVHKDGLYYYIADAVASGFAPGNVSLDHVICNDWYAVGEANGYPRSVKSIKDKRGLITRYEYDAKGSLQKVTKEGDLTGDGSTVTASTYLYYDTTRYLLKKVIEPLPAPGLPQRVTYYTYPTIAGGANSVVDPINSNYYLYAYLPQKVATYSVLSAALNEIEPAAGEKVLEVVNFYGRELLGGVEAHGLLKKVATSSPLNSSDKTETNWQFNSRGFPTSRTQKTFTTTADVTTLLEYNLKGELVKETDPAGRICVYEYDLMGRPTSKIRYASATAPSAVDWRLNYYNQNGEVVWEDGVYTFPEDYIFRDYDGSGRPIAEVRWRSQAKLDGTGVEEVPNQTAFLGQSITYFEYDGFGNLVSKIDPRGNESRMVYDALGELTTQTVAVGTADEAVESYLYEPGGQVRFHVNAKGGETTMLYTDSGQPVQTNTPDGRSEQWRYYLDGRLKTYTLSNGSVLTYTYEDKLLRETQEHAMGTTTLAKQITTYDSRHNAVKREEFAAAVSSYVFDTDYDGLNRVVRKAGPPAKTHPDTGETVSAQQITTFDHIYGSGDYAVVAFTGVIKRSQSYGPRDQLSQSLSVNTTTSKTEDETAFFMPIR
jgi:YD repeat-containing protein